MFGKAALMHGKRQIGVEDLRFGHVTWPGRPGCRDPRMMLSATVIPSTKPGSPERDELVLNCFGISKAIVFCFGMLAGREAGEGRSGARLETFGPRKRASYLADSGYASP